ncbi:aminoglycoside phosphotransferase (APT) family kinase protein [Thermocatellispora tengchongensis]|uniref:Aminoglycoside phosphotransferase (APT) family kinase protein n=1 Tax=Thermocatellispora tengchongensis TaxID=1073253 RepID=A0A840P198_9ACTN|nr:aminoglycoside phosphotransferase family protein [Thermocatellispora tengchongensis]MBB5135034.1 aminoglycoside phosphotransferase (APT) family kinase protein [Thermocatellispora tengchongensis]
MMIATGDAVLTRAVAALDQACRAAGLSTAGATLMRSFANAVYLLPAEDVVVRLADAGTPGKLDRLKTSVRVTRWLAEHDFPAIRPLEVRQPVAAEGFLITFWHHESDPAHTEPPEPASLGPMLRRLHTLPPVPFELPVYDPFGPIQRAVNASRVLGPSDRGWLLDRCSALAEDYYERVEFALPYGLIHGDAHRGNLVRASGRLLLCDWDSVSAGPREIDLIPTLQGARFGVSEEQRAAFTAGYGYDVTSWEWYGVLRDMRELRTLTAVLRTAHWDSRARTELTHRLESLKAGDNRRWTPF